MLDIMVIEAPSHELVSWMKDKSIFLIYILKEVIGEPFVTGVDHVIVTWLSEFAVINVRGGSGLYAQSSEMLLEYVL